MSVLADVLREARSGATTERIASRLDIDLGLAEAALDHWVRLGVVARSGETLGTACSGCVPEASRALSCAGCVFAQR